MNVKMNAMIYAILANGMFQKFCKALIILVLGVLAIRIIMTILRATLASSRPTAAFASISCWASSWPPPWALMLPASWPWPVC